jgi:L-fucose isomerase-like protein
MYYWYEALSTSFLKTDKPVPESNNVTLKKVHVEDVVVDDYDELLWRLHALYGVKNFIGTRIVALGGAGGKRSKEAPQVAKDKFKIEIIDISYDAFKNRITNSLADKNLVSQAEKLTDKYLAIANTTLKTDRKFVTNAFLLYFLLKNLMRENDATAITINSCMGTIIPMSETTACLPLSILNDEGYLAFCESDFVIIPPAILLRHISGKPVFMHNSTFPHKGIVTCAHCTGPRRMNGIKYEPAEIMTHYESEYGAAPKVTIPIGQEVTFLNPEYSTNRWLGFKGNVRSNPFFECCRSQQDVEIQGDWKKLLNEVRDSHWVMAYGDYLKEGEYAARRIGVKWEGIA